MAANKKTALEVPVAEVFGRRPWDKDLAVVKSRQEWLPAAEEGTRVVFDFKGVDFMTQSFGSALTTTLKRQLGPDRFEQLVWFENMNPLVRSVLSLAVSFPRRAYA